MSNCTIGYEVAFEVRSLNVKRSVVIVDKKVAKDFQRKWPGAKLTVVELCDGKIKRRGKRAFGARRRRK